MMDPVQTWDGPTIAATVFLVAEYLIKIWAIGVVPENRRPSSSNAWLLLILLLPAVGLPLFFLLGSPFINGRRHEIQREANQLMAARTDHLPDVPAGVDVPVELESLIHLNRRLTALPAVTSVNRGLSSDYAESIARMTASVERAEHYVHIEIYIVAWDATTDPFFTACAAAAARGVRVKLLLDHIGSRKYPGFRQLLPRLHAAGIDAHLMLPLQPWRGRWRRPDLRNHRKLVVVDGREGHMGSLNMIDSSYLVRKNQKLGRHWHEVTVELSGEIVAALDAVFAVDWYTETHQATPERHVDIGDRPVGGPVNLFQLVPSGPGFETEPNLRLFVNLMHLAQERLTICSPYFVPDESLLNAITTTAMRGVQVELFVSEQADQFMVDHAQSSYYRALLNAGVRIYRYPKPAVLHAKFFTVDDLVGVVGSSNMDMRSFGLNYEISLLGYGGDMVDELQRIAAEYREECIELTSEAWDERPWHQRYLDSVFRLTSALQ